MWRIKACCHPDKALVFVGRICPQHTLPKKIEELVQTGLTPPLRFGYGFGLANRAARACPLGASPTNLRFSSDPDIQKEQTQTGLLFLVPGTGLEPARYCYQGILSPRCLPFHHSGVNFILTLTPPRCQGNFVAFFDSVYPFCTIYVLREY